MDREGMTDREGGGDRLSAFGISLSIAWHLLPFTNHANLSHHEWFMHSEMRSRCDARSMGRISRAADGGTVVAIIIFLTLNCRLASKPHPPPLHPFAPPLPTPSAFLPLMLFKETNELSLNESWKTRTIAEPSIRIDDTDTNTDTFADRDADTDTQLQMHLQLQLRIAL